MTLFKKKLVHSNSCDYVNKYSTDPEHNLTCIQLNIRSVLSKRSHLITLIDDSIESGLPNIILLCETWLTPFSPELNILGYSFCPQDRKHKKGGGVGILLRNNLRYSIISDIKFKYNEFEGICVEVLMKNGSKSVFGSIYRPPNSKQHSFIADYNRLVCVLQRQNPTSIVLGMDHNMDLLKSTKHTITQHFVESNLDLQLIPMITCPTRITHTSVILIDNILVSQSIMNRCHSSILLDHMTSKGPRRNQCMLLAEIPDQRIWHH